MFMVMSFLMTLTSAFATTQFSPECPKEIIMSQHIHSTPAGWRSINSNAHYYLNYIAMYSGKPEELASLKPDFITKSKSTWNFSPHETIYIVCGYNQTAIQLTKPLPKQTRRCMVWFDQKIKSDYGFIPEKIICNK